MTKSANLHNMTIRQAAEVMNVSERVVKMAGELIRTGRNDLISSVEAGTITVHRALKLAKPEKYDKPPDGLKFLKSVWGRASEVDRRLFLVWVNNNKH